MWDIIWWVKTEAFFDVRSIEHVLSGVSVWCFVSYRNMKFLKSHTHTHTHTPSSIKYFDLIWVLFLAYLWETLEHYLEEWLAWDAVQYWFQWVEFWWNRLISDPLMLILWYYIAKRFPWFVVYARILSIAWLVVHVFFFPHSMYLHELLNI